jgi:hypothetical protein
LRTNIPLPHQWYPPIDHGAVFKGWSWRLPERVTDFQSTVDLSTLQNRLQQNSTINIVGSKGCGKSALAAEYAHTNIHMFSTVIWIQASSIAELAAEFQALASHLKLRVHEVSLPSYIDRVLAFLYKQPSWLLVFDNISLSTANIDILKRFQPRLKLAGEGEGQIVSPRPVLNQGKIIYLSTLAIYPESISVKGGVKSKDYSAILKSNSLAITLANAYTSKTSVSSAQKYAQQISDVIQNFASNKLRKNRVIAAIALSVKAVCTARSDACSLLQFISLLPSGSISYDLVQEYSANLGIDLESSLQLLHSFNLIDAVRVDPIPDKFGVRKRIFSMNASIQDALLSHSPVIFSVASNEWVWSAGNAAVALLGKMVHSDTYFLEIGVGKLDINSIPQQQIGDLFAWSDQAPESAWISSLYTPLSVAYAIVTKMMKHQPVQFPKSTSKVVVDIVTMLGYHFLFTLHEPVISTQMFQFAYDVAENVGLSSIVSTSNKSIDLAVLTAYSNSVAGFTNEAKKSVEKSQKMIQSKWKGTDASADYKTQPAWIFLVMVSSDIAVKENNIDLAVKLLQEAVTLSKTNDKMNLMTVYIIKALADLYKRQNKLEECFTQHQVALELEMQILSEKSNIVSRHYQLIASMWEQTQPNRELQLVYRAYNLAKSLFDEFDPRFADASASLGGQYFMIKRDRAFKPLEDALKAETEAAGDVHVRVANRRVQIAGAFYETGKLDKAVYHYLEIYHTYLTMYGVNHELTQRWAAQCIKVHEEFQQQRKKQHELAQQQAKVEV